MVAESEEKWRQDCIAGRGEGGEGEGLNERREIRFSSESVCPYEVTRW